MNNLRPFLIRAKDPDAALNLLKAVMEGSRDDAKRLIDAGAECGLTRLDVDRPALLMNGAGTAMFTMLNLHAQGKTLNAPLYFAAFKGDAKLTEHLLDNAPYDRDSLNAALYGATVSQQRDLVQKLIRLGADAACGDGACVTAAIQKRRLDIADILLASGKSYTAALSSALDMGMTDRVIDYLANGAEPLEGLKAICRRLSEATVARDRRRDKEYMDTFEVILSYATGFGTDIPQLLHQTMTYAIDRSALGVADAIVQRPEFAALASRETHASAALSSLATASFRGFRAENYPRYAELVDALLNHGASAQAGLERGSESGSDILVGAALSRGADPRRNNRAAIRGAVREDMRQLLRETEDRLDAEDYKIFRTQGPLTLERVRDEVPGMGRTGLAVMAAAGDLPRALDIYRQANAPITPADLTRKGSGGYSTLDALCDKGCAGLLLDPALWLLREAEYRYVFDRMSPAAQASLGEAHEEVLSRLASHRTTVQLKNQAEAHRKRLKPK